MGDAVPALNVLFTILADLSFSLLVGKSLAGYWLDLIPTKCSPSGNHAGSADAFGFRRVSIACVAVLLACHLVRPWFVASAMSGSTQFGEALALIPTVLSSTRQGVLWYANCAAVVLLLAAQFSAEFRSASALWMEFGALCVLAATKAASSHASEAGDFTLAEISQFLHILSTAVWAGAIVVSGLLVVPRLHVLAGVPALWSYGKRLSQTVTYALITLAGTGAYASWSDAHGTWSVVWTTAWGRTLLAKVTLAGLAALLGSAVRFRCLGLPADHRRAAAMAKLLRGEAVVMFAVICLSGVLANANPAGIPQSFLVAPGAQEGFASCASIRTMLFRRGVAGTASVFLWVSSDARRSFRSTRS